MALLLQVISEAAKILQSHETSCDLNVEYHFDYLQVIRYVSAWIERFVQGNLIEKLKKTCQYSEFEQFADFGLEK